MRDLQRSVKDAKSVFISIVTDPAVYMAALIVGLAACVGTEAAKIIRAGKEAEKKAQQEIQMSKPDSSEINNYFSLQNYLQQYRGASQHNRVK